MKIVIKPSIEVLNRALALGWEKQVDFYIEEEKRIGLMITSIFKPMIYYGVLTFKKHRIIKDEQYAISRDGPAYRGELIKNALTVLGTKRVRVFLHLPEREKDQKWQVLLLGTKDGTVAIAPLIPPSPNDPWLPDEVELMKTVVKKMSRKLLRSFVYSAL